MDRQLLFRDLNYRMISLKMEIFMDMERAGGYLMGKPGLGEWDTIPEGLRKLADKIDRYLRLTEIEPIVRYFAEVDDEIPQHQDNH